MRWLSLFCLLLHSLPGRAQLPSEILLIVNGSSPDALRVAHTYIHLRAIPSERVLVLEPERAFFKQAAGSPQWSADEKSVRDTVLNPVTEKLAQLDDSSPTALIFSPDWPTRVRVAGSPSVSLTAFIGCGGELPEAKLIKEGKAASPWFAHPKDVSERRARLRRYPAPELMEAKFHPAAMLGVFYPPLDTDDVEEALERSVGADYTRPEGTVAIVTNQNVRTKARFHQFASAKASLERKNIPVLMDNARAKLPRTLIGVMTGAANVNTSPYEGKLVPGSFAEHLTSFAATFDTPGQTKLTEWIAAGAAASVGTVTEPLSIWTKFPMAVVFERYLMGNTVLEALMQSIGSPYQTLIVGDPLCRPWAEGMDKLSLDTTWREHQLVVTAENVSGGSSAELHLFADGKRVPGSGPEWTWEPSAEETGSEIELILHARHLWAPPEIGRVRTRISTPFPDRLRLNVSQKRGDLRIRATSEEDLLQWELHAQGRILFSDSTSGTRHAKEIPVTHTGGGPLTLRARGITANGKVVVSNSLELNL